jgi:hypothetical protein
MLELQNIDSLSQNTDPDHNQVFISTNGFDLDIDLNYM